MSKDKGLSEQAFSQAAEAGFSSQLDEVEELDVDIQTNPLKAVQGKADSVSISCGESSFILKLHFFGDSRSEMLCLSSSSISAALH
ncbi:MAG: LmeA family phospholipid-binding protein [Coleofasciculus sp. G1-WW12-02]|uniref:LmeA family phospholipid-binding protein n=1 Tax=unclassified Coleofasciculus TaxID=2692782 RepID=UPI0032FE51BD